MKRMNRFRKRQSRVPSLLPCLLVAFEAAAGTTDFPFGTPESIALPEELSPTCIALADRDGDGDLDAVVASRTQEGRIILLDGGPGGTLAVVGELAAPDQTDWIETADLDGDGDLEIVAGVRGSRGRIAIFDGLPGGTFAETPLVLPAGREIRCLRIDDLDGDGVPDIVAVAHRSEELITFLGDGLGGFELVQRSRLAPWRNGQVYPQSIETADLDLDGNPDTLTVSIGASSVHLARGTDAGPGTRSRAWVAPPVGGQTGGSAYLSIADLDGDGLPELVLPQTTFGQQWFVLHELDARGDIESSRTVQASPFGVSWISDTADFDADGDEDLCIGHALPGVLVFMENVTEPGGPASFAEPQWLFQGEFIRHLIACDVDFDGDQDVVALDYTGDQILIFRNGTVGGGLAGGDPRDGAKPDPTPEALRSLEGPELLKLLSDLDGDGVTDLRRKDRTAGGAR